MPKIRIANPLPGSAKYTTARQAERYVRRKEAVLIDSTLHFPSPAEQRRARIVRRAFLKRHPLCAVYQGKGILKVAKVVDHIIPHKGDPGIFWDQSQWQSLCVSCHSRKTAVSDGRWGLFYRKIRTPGAPKNKCHHLAIILTAVII